MLRYVSQRKLYKSNSEKEDIGGLKKKCIQSDIIQSSSISHQMVYVHPVSFFGACIV